MHRVLEIQELLLNIFSHCHPLPADLASLAGTCRAFKESALDVLWERLDNLTPLVRCLPNASHGPSNDNLYSYSRPLTQSEWGILRGYTRRIRSIADTHQGTVGVGSLIILSNAPTTQPLFPNVRHLHFETADGAMPLLRLPFPSLISLDLQFADSSMLQHHLESFPSVSPSFSRLSVRLRTLPRSDTKINVELISRWHNLQALVCPLVTLDADALTHLSHLPTLTQLNFSPKVTSPVPDSLHFSNLRIMELYSETLEPISWLLSQIRLPAVTSFSALIGSRPSEHGLSSFLAGLQTSGVSSNVLEFHLRQLTLHGNGRHLEVPPLGLDGLLPYMAFSNLRWIEHDFEWNVILEDRDLLKLTSAWPHLERLDINLTWGWNTPGGITPDGLLQLLQMCRSLRRIALALDTRNYVRLPMPPKGPRLTSSPEFYINVVDSIINYKAVPTIAAFFAAVAPSSGPDIRFLAWDGEAMTSLQRWNVNKTFWYMVFKLVKDTQSALCS